MAGKARKRPVAKRSRTRAARAKTTTKAKAKRPVAKRKAVTKPKAAKRPGAKKLRTPKRSAAKKATRRPAASPKRAEILERNLLLERQTRRDRRALRKLERQLVALIEELGQIRHFELRARQLEAECAKRDDELRRLKGDLDDRLQGAQIVSSPA